MLDIKDLLLLFGFIDMDSKVADELQDYAVKLTCTLKHNHDFLLSDEYHMLMLLLYNVIDKTADSIYD